MPGTEARETILFVDDDPGVREIAERALLTVGYRAFTASSAELALQALDGLSARPDLLVADVVMPGMNGLELAWAVSQKIGGISVLFISGKGELSFDPDLSDGRGFLRKPYTARALLGRVRQMLDHPGKPPN